MASACVHDAPVLTAVDVTARPERHAVRCLASRPGHHRGHGTSSDVNANPHSSAALANRQDSITAAIAKERRGNRRVAAERLCGSLLRSVDRLRARPSPPWTRVRSPANGTTRTQFWRDSLQLTD